MLPILAILVLALSASGGTFYVATNGNDGASGQIGAPWLTIRHGVMSMSSGDTLNIRGGNYPDDGHLLQEFVSGTSAAAPTIIQSYAGEWAVYTPNVGGEYAAHGLILSSKSNIVLNGFEINATNCTSDGIKLDQGTVNVTVTNMFVHGCGNGMGLLTTGVNEGDYMNALVSHCRFQTNGWNATTNDPPLHQVYIQTSGITVENCYIEGATNIGGGTLGIHYFGSHSTNAVFRNNYVTNCSTGIGVLATGGSDCWVYNNIICGGYSWGISVYKMSNVYVLNNTCYTNNAGINVESSTNIWVENNIAASGYANNPGGIYVNTASNVFVRNNLSYGCTAGGNRTFDFKTNASVSITISGNLIGVTQTATNDVYSAKFQNQIQGDFRLTAGSDAIRNGRAQTLFGADYSGATRIAWDIGAYYFFLPGTATIGTARFY